MRNAKCKMQNAKAERLHVSPLLHFDFCILNSVVALLVVATSVGAAQIGGTLVVGGNPTPGTEQPEPPDLADRITITGCLEAVRRGGSLDPPTSPPTDANTPSDTRFQLANAERIDRVPAGTGGSPAAASAASRSYRLMGIESQFSAFVGTTVEISGEIKPAAASDAKTPTVIVEFIQKLASSCK
jgi:hypothetical protein